MAISEMLSAANGLNIMNRYRERLEAFARIIPTRRDSP